MRPARPAEIFLHGFERSDRSIDVDGGKAVLPGNLFEGIAGILHLDIVRIKLFQGLVEIDVQPPGENSERHPFGMPEQGLEIPAVDPEILQALIEKKHPAKGREFQGSSRKYNERQNAACGELPLQPNASAGFSLYIAQERLAAVDDVYRSGQEKEQARDDVDVSPRRFGEPCERPAGPVGDPAFGGHEEHGPGESRGCESEKGKEREERPEMKRPACYEKHLIPCLLHAAAGRPEAALQRRVTGTV